MNKNYLFAGAGILVVLLAVLGIIFILKPAEQTPAPVAFPVESTAIGTGTILSAETVIEKTDDGFSPKEITLKKGSAVRFVNKSSSPMWVASSSHPTHTDYPGFDQKANEDTFTFLFDKVGSWKYHNHSPFSPGGTIIVVQ